MTHEEIFKMEYSQAQKLVRGWARIKVNLDMHTKRAERYFPSDQGKREESQPDITTLTERLRALQIQLSQVGPSDRRHQIEDIRTAYRPQQLWGCQPLVHQVVHQAQGNTVRTQDSPRQDSPRQDISRQGQLYDYETRQHRPYPNRWGTTTRKCVFCAMPGHLVSQCGILEDLNRDGFLRWDPMDRAYFLGGDYKRQTAIQVPTYIERKATQEGKSILREVCDWVMSNNLDPQFQRLAAYYLRRDFGITKNDTSTLQIQSSSQPPQVQDNRLQTPGLVQPETAKTNTALSPDIRSADLVVTKILTRSIVEDLDSTTVEPFLQPSD
ncbi:uncharacterized protein BCR38DRAFT_3920 [Pseudomassariella vexata]|uniref:Uncharacterized protein n=1 Tax=Pseudomassariella vexata TaxID=1141098 RepID=A0A1Y2EI59_9PEZI|nr:uncharacterized protein BCR38DRAFT_3920 [Pseudomassariella vexata]ORY71127.1 hypothetical protein BCR38DRAFT_3920 [Pseudomassariella vexata]